MIVDDGKNQETKLGFILILSFSVTTWEFLCLKCKAGKQ